MEVGFVRLQQDCREQGGEFQEVTRRYPTGSWINKSEHWEEVMYRMVVAALCVVEITQDKK